MFNTHDQYSEIKATEFTNTATLNINETPIDSTNITFLVAESTDISVTMINPMHVCYVGQNLIYFIKITNNNSTKATGVILTDILPPNSICSYINLTKGVYKRFRSKIVFYLGELYCNENVIAIISIIPKYPCILTNHCFVTAKEPDTNWNNNICSTNTKVYPIRPKSVYCVDYSSDYL